MWSIRRKKCNQKRNDARFLRICRHTYKAILNLCFNGTDFFIVLVCTFLSSRVGFGYLAIRHPATKIYGSAISRLCSVPYWPREKHFVSIALSAIIIEPCDGECTSTVLSCRVISFGCIYLLSPKHSGRLSLLHNWTNLFCVLPHSIHFRMLWILRSVLSTYAHMIVFGLAKENLKHMESEISKSHETNEESGFLLERWPINVPIRNLLSTISPCINLTTIVSSTPKRT